MNHSSDLKHLVLFLLFVPTVMAAMPSDGLAQKSTKPMTGKQNIAQKEGTGVENERGILSQLGEYRFLPTSLTNTTDDDKSIEVDSDCFELDARFRQEFVATAYSTKNYTACGVMTAPGIVAADPKVIPLGSIIKVVAGRYSGIYRVLDTGPGIRGKRLDIYVNCRSEAINFGKQRVQIEVLRYGWGNREDTTWGE